ncbi:hypothetical protein L2E82_33523 [Cichorium intybus]|uniref:Uncharacterized protein n=1 Tax=Cichorium intybus TaxID=13427 RepID=A0ACB9BKR6_CICIN|nr:hypothetical protein L2E82_33523 [Cichorium intybus]
MKIHVISYMYFVAMEFAHLLSLGIHKENQKKKKLSHWITHKKKFRNILDYKDLKNAWVILGVHRRFRNQNILENAHNKNES